MSRKKNYVHSETTKIKIKLGNRDYHWYNNGLEEVKEKKCPDGFVKGRLKKYRWATNGEQTFFVKEIPEGFHVGRTLNIPERHWFNDGRKNYLAVKAPKGVRFKGMKARDTGVKKTPYVAPAVTMPKIVPLEKTLLEQSQGESKPKSSFLKTKIQEMEETVRKQEFNNVPEEEVKVEECTDNEKLRAYSRQRGGVLNIEELKALVNVRKDVVNFAEYDAMLSKSMSH